MSKELTREEFAQEIKVLNEKGVEFNAESVDSGSIFIAFTGTITVNFEAGIDGEITFFKPYGNMEMTLDFNMVDAITQYDDGSYRLEMDNGISDIEISVAK